MPGTASTAATAPLRRLVCVSPNTSIDKIAAVDVLRPGEIHRPEVLSVVPGGKALNVARSAAGLGMRVTAVALLAGHAGAWVVERLAGEGVAVRAVWGPGETRECLSLLDRSTGLLTELYEPGPAIAGGTWDELEAALAAELGDDPEGTLVAVSGSVPAGGPPGAHARIVRLARSAGARAAVDVGGAALAGATAEGLWLAKANAREAAEATGLAAEGEAEALAAARALRAAGASIALVSRGVDGAVLIDRSGLGWRIGRPPELGAFPVGSGDSLLGGFAAALGAGHVVPEAARRGAAAAAANALQPGQARIDPVDLARLLPRVTLERLP